jgi:transcriptional regulator with XRE-family HTH domain
VTQGKNRKREKKRDPHNVALGKAVVTFREANPLTQEELAERTKLSIKALGEIEKGEVEALWGDLRRIAYGLKIRLPQLFGLAEKIEDRQERPPAKDEKQQA